MTTDSSNMPIEELAALYASGALTESELAAVESRLEQGDPQLSDAISEFCYSTETLAAATDAVLPPAHIKNSLMGRIKADAEATGSAFFFQRAESAPWEDIGIPGARVRTLFVDRERRFKTFLLQMEAGCEIPAHPHGEAEECYVINGDIFTSGRELGPGDYVRAPSGSQHGRSYTKDGCLLLITAGLDEHDMN